MGGFSKHPTVAELKAMRDKMIAAVPDLEATIETVAALAGGIPAFERPTEYMAVTSDEEYGLYDGYVQTILPDGDRRVRRRTTAATRTSTCRRTRPRSSPRTASTATRLVRSRAST
jgi:hypothetical protein